MWEFGSRFSQDGGAEQVTIRYMCLGMQESSSWQEAIDQGTRCSLWFLFETLRNRSRGVLVAQVGYRLLKDFLSLLSKLISIA